ncbi:hypothetical protein VKT23_003419 [Stygiomarasmius scandens]|uniref:Protein kinase domain-containing protein n=1 Tax=Marasmiellus scandens TaxID=2682957 RepID=A0ABR1JYU9_9AGAR
MPLYAANGFSPVPLYSPYPLSLNPLYILDCFFSGPLHFLPESLYLYDKLSNMAVPASTPGYTAYPRTIPERNAITQSQLSTPLGKGASTQANFEEKHKVEDLNVYLEEDIHGRVCIEAEDFLSFILDLSPDNFSNLKAEGGKLSDVKKDENFDKAWTAYLKLATKETTSNEKELYEPLIAVMDAACRVWFPPGAPFCFFDGSGQEIHGSYAGRKPDITALDSKFTFTSDNMKPYWPMIMWWLEVKRKHGNALDCSGLIGGAKSDGRDIKPIPKTLARVSGSASCAPQMTAPSRPTATKRKKGRSSTISSDVQTTSTSQHTYELRSRNQASAQAPNNDATPESTPLTEAVALRPDTGRMTPPRCFAASHVTTSAQAIDEEEDDTEDKRASKRRKDEKGEKVAVPIGDEMDSVAEEKLSIPDLKQHTQLQSAGYGLEMLSSGLLRCHSIGLVVDAHMLQIAYYDRSKVVLSKPVSLSTEEGQDIFLSTLYQLSFLNDRQNGLLPVPIDAGGPSLPTIQPLLNKQYLTSCQNQAKKPKHPGTRPPIDSINDKHGAFPGCNAFYGCCLTLEAGKVLQLKELVYRAHGIIGRGTTVIKALDWDQQEVIVKLSFPGEKRDPEDELVKEAHSKATGEHEWAKNHLPDIRWSGTFKFGEDMPQSKLAAHFRVLDIPYEERVLRITVQDVLHPITDLIDPKECAQVFYDVLQVHRWLVDYGKILHRDISMANIMFRRINGLVYGVLNDFDLASRLPPPDKPTSLQRTGTKPYMSHDLLDPTWEMGHVYRHDLESLFYVVLILCCHYEKHPSSSQLQKTRRQRPFDIWFSGSHKTVWRDKTAWLTLSDPIEVTPLFDGFESSLVELKYNIADGHSAKDRFKRGIDMGQRKNDEHGRDDEDEDDDDDDDSTSDSPFDDSSPREFDWTTLGGHVTYKRFMKVMRKFKGKNLISRYPKHLLLDLKESDFLRSVTQK